MKKLLTCVILLVTIQAHAYNSIWQQVSNANVPAKGTAFTRATQYAVYSLNIAYIKGMLSALSGSAVQGQVIELPQPDGTYRAFNVWQTAMMEPGLANSYPQIKTFTGVALDNNRVTAKLDFTPRGLHAMIYDGDNTTFIDPYSLQDDSYYIVHYRRDEVLPVSERSVCQFTGQDENGPAGVGVKIGNNNNGLPQLEKIASGYQARTYRLALACSHQYALAATGMAAPTIADVLGAMVTSMNRINGVYEREFSITMLLVANDTNIIFNTATNDPYSSINTNANSLLPMNQLICDSLIGTANYDLGHVFTTNGGGLSQLGCICNPHSKAESETGLPAPKGDGFDIDYVAHEMGHEFGANHPFNNGTDGSCGGGNRHGATAYEPGSGSTIMAYAGICSPDDLSQHSDAYFHAISLKEIYNYSIIGNGNQCSVKDSTHNTPAGLPAFAISYNIPYKTPFELIAPVATDTAADTLNTYCWEEWDLGAAERLEDTHITGPIFRSFNPDTSRTRIFPKLDSVLNGTYSYVSTASNSKFELHEGEKVPDTARTLIFKLTERAIFQGFGSFLTPDDSIHLNVINTGAAFAVTSQAGTFTYWQQGNTDSVTWDVVGTNTAPISCDSVNIYLSTDGGYTWPILLGEYPNTGAALITVPLITTSTARVKVKGANNVFFNVTHINFPIGTKPQSVTSVALNQVKVYPSPASGAFHIVGTALNAAVYNVIGQAIYKGSIDGDVTVPVSGWASGIYYVQLTDAANGQRVVKSVVIN